MKAKGRPKKTRLIEKAPRILQFSPRGKPGRPDEAALTIDQLEAIRLVDFQGLKQSKAAGHMGLSRQTIGRIIKEARRGIADALINGKIIRISGGMIKLKKSA